MILLFLLIDRTIAMFSVVIHISRSYVSCFVCTKEGGGGWLCNMYLASYRVKEKEMWSSDRLLINAYLFIFNEMRCKRAI